MKPVTNISSIVWAYRTLKRNPSDATAALSNVNAMKMTPEQLEKELEAADKAFKLSDLGGEPRFFPRGPGTFSLYEPRRPFSEIEQGMRDLVATTTASVARLWDGTRKNGEVDENETLQLEKNVGKHFSRGEAVELSLFLDNLYRGAYDKELEKSGKEYATL